MKFRPGVVPQWPSSRGLTCSALSGSSEQRIVEQIDLADREIVGRAPVAVYEFELREVGLGCSILQNRASKPLIFCSSGSGAPRHIKKRRRVAPSLVSVALAASPVPAQSW